MCSIAIRLSRGLSSLLIIFLVMIPQVALAESVARQWNELALELIRIDFPAPTVHSRNLYHLSAAMYDAWAAFDADAGGVFFKEKFDSSNVDESRNEAISYAAYQVLSKRYSRAVNPSVSMALIDQVMLSLGYNPEFSSVDGNSPAAIGNRIAEGILNATRIDGSNELSDYIDNTGYVPLNEPMIVDHPSITGPDGPALADINHWQPLFVSSQTTQNGIVIGDSLQKYIGPHWGSVETFALGRNSLQTGESWSDIDPGLPPQFGSAAFIDNALQVIQFSSRLDPNSEVGGELINISPKISGNRPLGTHDDWGYSLNPISGQPYADNFVSRADYGRVLAEYWADGPKSETPPGHWNVIANEVTDHPLLEKRIAAVGPVVSDLEWDVKLYLALGGAMHDAAVAAWGVKRAYDYSRPISMIRYLGSLGQSSSAAEASYNPNGLPLISGLIELVSAETIQSGGRHRNVYVNANQTGSGSFADNFTESELVGKVAILAWNHEPENPAAEVSGVDWILAENWVPYQQDNFVTPAFAAYVSGHSTFSRAAAEVLSLFTGSEYFPGGLGQKTFPANNFLDFELGPSSEVTLQWAKYFDAADEAGISRLHGGIHVAPDDFAGRIMGSTIGKRAFELASDYFAGGGAVTVPIEGLSRAEIKSYVREQLDPLVVADLPYIFLKKRAAKLAITEFLLDSSTVPSAEKKTPKRLNLRIQVVVTPRGDKGRRIRRLFVDGPRIKRLSPGKYTAKYRLVVKSGKKVVSRTKFSRRTSFRVRR